MPSRCSDSISAALVDGVDLVAACALLDQGAAQNALGARAPELHLHAVFLLERGDQDAHVVGGHRRIDGQHALLLRARDQPLGAVGTGIRRKLGKRRGLGCCRTAQRQHVQHRLQCKHDRNRHGVLPEDMRLVSPASFTAGWAGKLGIASNLK
jgi:hypothetical protein